MMNPEQSKLIDEILHGLPLDDANSIKNEILQSFGPVGDEIRAIDPSLTSKDSYVFLWNDLVSLDSAVSVVKEQFAGQPELHVKLIKSLAGLWIKMRAIRVQISEAEAKVLRAVKRR